MQINIELNPKSTAQAIQAKGNFLLSTIILNSFIWSLVPCEELTTQDFDSFKVSEVPISIEYFE